MRFSLRTLFLICAVAAICAVCVQRYRQYRQDYLPLPPNPNVHFVTQAEIDDIRKTPEFHRDQLKQHSPAKQQDYWERCLARVRPQMMAHALNKYVPPAGPSYSLLRSDGNQTYYYPIDEKHGVACVVDMNDRIVKPLFIFEHSLAVDSFGGITLDELPKIQFRLSRSE